MLLAFEYAPGLGADTIVPAGDSTQARCGTGSSIPVICGEAGRGADAGGGFKMDLIDDSRLLLLLSGSDGLAESFVSPKDRFRVGERNEAGESELCRSDVPEREVMGARRCSSSRDCGVSL